MTNSTKPTLTIENILKSKREQVLALAAKHGAYNVRVFGSVARGEAGPASDIDFLIEPNPSWSLLDHIRFKQALEELLGIRVDVVTDKTLHPRIRARVLKEAVKL